VWTHNLRDIVWNENYSSESYTGPAVKVQSGVQGREVTKSAHDRGYVVVGGNCPVSRFYPASSYLSDSLDSRLATLEDIRKVVGMAC